MRRASVWPSRLRGTAYNFYRQNLRGLPAPQKPVPRADATTKRRAEWIKQVLLDAIYCVILELSANSLETGSTFEGMVRVFLLVSTLSSPPINNFDLGSVRERPRSRCHCHSLLTETPWPSFVSPLTPAEPRSDATPFGSLFQWIELQSQSLPGPALRLDYGSQSNMGLLCHE